MSDPRSHPIARFPVKLLAAALVLTSVLLVGLVWSAYESYRRVDTVQLRDLRIQELCGTIVHLDEVLTMSARMAATTGDLSWEQRYRRHEVELDAAVNEAITLTARAGSAEGATQTDEANEKLIAMENEAFALVRAGRADEARAVLFSAAYAAQKKVYADGVDKLVAQLQTELTASRQQKKREAVISMIAVAAAILLLSGAWLKVVRRLKHWRDAQLHSFAQLATAQEQIRQSHGLLEKRVQERTAELSAEVAAREAAQQNLEATHRQLVDASRHAGMAEIATSVLHNVGNVLNSINVSASLIEDHLGDNKLHNVRRVADLLLEHESDLPALFATDRGRQLPRFVADLAEYLHQRRQASLTEVKRLVENINHVKRVISSQQSIATGRIVSEPIDMAAVIEEALRIQLTSMQRSGIELVKHLEAVPHVVTDKHLVLQILINVLSNACKALRHSDCPHKRITVRLAVAAAHVEIADNGVGIEREQLTRIFTFGFSGWEGGHGFGLHGAANAARQIGGDLSVASEGPGCGARFRLEVPVHRRIQEAAA